MGDAEIRALERAHTRGEPDSWPLLVLERVKSGVITPARLEAAAVVGDAVARRLVGWPTAIYPSYPTGTGQHIEVTAMEAADQDPLRWMRRLARVEPEALARAAVAACEVMFETRSCHGGVLVDGTEINEAEERLVASEDALVRPSPARLKRLAALRPNRPERGWYWFWPRGLVETVHAFLNGPREELEKVGPECVLSCFWYDAREDVAERVRSEVARWALGAHDAVLARHEARASGAAGPAREHPLPDPADRGGLAPARHERAPGPG